METDAEIKQETKEAKKKEVQLIIKKTAMEIVRGEAETNLAEQQTYKIVEEIMQG
jgi:hypothetical protein